VRDAVGVLLPIPVVAGILAGDALGPRPAIGALVVTGALIAPLTLGVPRGIAALCIAVALGTLGCAMECRALDGLASGTVARLADARADVTADVVLVDDPDGTRWSTQVLARVVTITPNRHREVRTAPHVGLLREHRTVLVTAAGDATGRLAVLTVGDRAVLRGWLHPLDGFDRRMRWRHAVAELDADELVTASFATSVTAAVANHARALTLAGAQLLPATERALVAGFLLGDTRDLPEPVVQSFRDAGLSHLLAVSGANVAFVLALVGPVLRRSPRLARLITTLLVLGLFGAMTRWEPSVLRACAMAAIAVMAAHVGRPTGGLRILALALTALLVIDPFLLRSVGFLLSCGASLGITLLAGPIARRLVGPAWLRESLGTTAAAQLGVAPVLLPVFGSVPLVAFPANLLAVPLAGPLTTWGLTGGVLAGLVRTRAPSLARLLQLPTRVLAEAVMGLARLAATTPLAVDARGALGLGAAACMVVALVAVVRTHRRNIRARAMVVPPR
jgi:competence protein ComEC